jgi:hypothetical protein
MMNAINNMSNAAKSIFVYGIYLLILSVVLLLIPNIPLAILGLPTTNEVWIRVVGAMAVSFGTYFVRAARSENTDFFRWTISTRLGLVVFFSIFVVVGLAPINLLLLAIPDLPFVLWTVLALRSSKAASPLRAS